MNLKPKISVIIPIYNSIQYLEYCLQSIVNQTYKNLEIICVNDGSTDQSLNKIKEFQEMDNRIFIINKKTGGGVSAARNSGIEIATGDFIAFVDSDDEVHPQYFETLVYWAIQKEADLMACRFLNAKKLPMFSHQNFDIAKMNVTQYSFLQAQNDAHLKTHVWGMIYSKKILRKITFIPNLKFGEDRIFQFEVQTQNSGMNIYCADAPLYYYYQKPRDAWEGYPPLETLKLAKWYLKYDFSGNKEAESIACREAIKMLLSCRYSLMFYPEYIPKKRECNGIIKDVIRISSRKSIFDRKQMFIYSVMAYIPISYRLFRIVQDPTMISYEKNMRKWNKRRL